ncbi:MAG TPA: ABC transporter ATP-binding protein [Reyranella sp.]|jgi:putative spermidine/putrescine transport system ATP-binding protein
MAEASGSGEVAVVGVTKRFGETTAVKDLSLTIPHGSYCCLLGPSGCGKTTILRMIAGHENPTTGDIRIGGESVVGLPQVRRGTAMMFQSYALFPHRSVLDNVAFALKMRGAGLAERHAKARELLTKVQLDNFADRLPAQLSGGQQQRVALARALITNPRVLLLDEPLSALDEYLRLRMRGELRRVQKELGITFIHVTHTQLEAIAVADTVVVMAHGHIEQAASARDIFIAPRNAYVARFVGGQNVLSGTVESAMNGTAAVADENGARFAFPVGGIRPLRGSKLWGSIRRDRIALEKVPPGSKPAGGLNTIAGEVHTIENQGSYVKVTLELGHNEEFVAHLLDETFFANPLDIGDRVVARWSASDIKLLDDGPVTHEQASAQAAVATAG